MPVGRDRVISSPALEQEMCTQGPRAFCKVYLSILTLKSNLHIYVYMYVCMYVLEMREFLSVT